MKNNRFPLKRQWTGLLTALTMIALLAATGCQSVAPVRTLPSWVRGIYVPMVTNSSYEPGLEEVTTHLVQEEFLADGRLAIVPKGMADLVVSAEILDWTARTSGTSGEDIGDQQEITVLAKLQLYEPTNMDEPLADLGRIMLITGLDTDVRETKYIPEPDSKKKILAVLARRIVQKTIEGFPTNLQGLPAGAVMPDYKAVEDISAQDILVERVGNDE